MPRCPVCHRSTALRAENPLFPFCSDRCRLVDLGKWLGEGYRIPAQPEEGDEPGAAEAEGPEPSEDD